MTTSETPTRAASGGPSRLSGLQQNVQRIDHIVICVWPENLEAAVKKFSEVLDIEFEGPVVSEKSGLTFYIDWSSGMEVVAPTNPELAIVATQFLEERGEGLFRLVFGVADNEAALARASALGHEVASSRDVLELNPAWGEHFARIDEALIRGDVHGVGLLFGQIEPR